MIRWRNRQSYGRKEGARDLLGRALAKTSAIADAKLELRAIEHPLREAAERLRALQPGSVNRASRCEPARRESEATLFLIHHLSSVAGIPEDAPIPDVRSVLLAIPEHRRPAVLGLLEKLVTRGAAPGDEALGEAVQLVLDAAREVWAVPALPQTPVLKFEPRFAGRGLLGCLVVLLLVGTIAAVFGGLRPQRDRRIILTPPHVLGDDVVTLALWPTVVRLDGLEGPHWGAVCQRHDGSVWACGMRAREAIRALIGERQVVCHAEHVGADKLNATCEIDSRDLGAMLVEAGWARPTGRGRYEAEASTARVHRAGLWSDTWH